MDIEVYDLYKRTYKCDERESIRFAPMISKIYLDSVKKQRDQYKAERDTLIDELAWYKAKVERLERENRFLLSRKDNLFDSWRDENKRSVALSKRLEQLKRENGELQEVIEDKNSDLLFAEDENEQLKQDLLRTEELQDEIIQLEKDFENKHNLLSEISQHIGNKPSSSTYKYFREKLDSIGIKVNKNIEAPMDFIKRIAKEDE